MGRLMDPVEPPDSGSLDDSTRELIELTGIRNGGTPLAIIEVLAHRPDMVGPFLQWSAALASSHALGGRRHEIAALRASWHFQSDYEWGNHARYAVDAGVTEEEISALGEEGGTDAFTDPVDRLVIGVVDEMIEGSDVPSRDLLREALGDAALVDLVWTVGQYVGLSLVADTLGIPVGDDLRRAPPRLRR